MSLKRAGYETLGRNVGKNGRKVIKTGQHAYLLMPLRSTDRAHNRVRRGIQLKHPSIANGPKLVSKLHNRRGKLPD